MSYGTRKAIAGTMKGERIAHENCLAAIDYFNACKTFDDIQAVLAWAKEQNWFLRTSEDDKLMHAAYDEARKRAANDNRTNTATKTS